VWACMIVSALMARLVVFAYSVLAAEHAYKPAQPTHTHTLAGLSPVCATRRFIGGTVSHSTMRSSSLRLARRAGLKMTAPHAQCASDAS